MNLNFLPYRILKSLNKINLDKVYEIRIRVNQPIFLLGNGINFNLLNDEGDDIIASSNDVNEIISNLTEKSLYAYNDKIKNGYLTWKNGIRIGLCGDCVEENGKVITIKDISSLNIRIPRKVVDCSNIIFSLITKEKINNSLIISPPGYGKTTILKDIIRNFTLDNKYTILVVDERLELTDGSENVDVIKNSSKINGFNCGIRSMRPDIIITDELIGESDWKCVYNAIKTGVKVIATCHGDSIEMVEKMNLEYYCAFDLYFLLDSCGVPGKLKRVYNKNFDRI